MHRCCGNTKVLPLVLLVSPPWWRECRVCAERASSASSIAVDIRVSAARAREGHLVAGRCTWACACACARHRMDGRWRSNCCYRNIASEMLLWSLTRLKGALRANFYVGWILTFGPASVAGPSAGPCLCREDPLRSVRCRVSRGYWPQNASVPRRFAPLPPWECRVC